jgi:molecular chaperone IbpA
MRHFDFTPLYRASIGFDQIADLMDRVSSADSPSTTYPPYNIEKTDNDAYRISIAVAGFSEKDLSVEVKESALVVSAKKSETKDAKSYLHQGIATRSFKRKFDLADHVRVTAASHADGMLHIDLKREVPEALKPRRIEIVSSDSSVIDGTSIS